MSVHDAKVLRTEDLDPKDAKWTKLVLTHYTDPNNRARTWESAIRATRPSTGIDSVGIVTILRRSDRAPTILLQKQFRPALGRVCIEVPAGLVDEGETPLEAAKRELLEETGYTGDVIGDGIGVSHVWYPDPGLTNTNVVMVHVVVDLQKEENKEPKPRLDDGEFIENYEVEVDGLWDYLREMEEEGYAVDARVGGVAEGWELARKFGGLLDGAGK